MSQKIYKSAQGKVVDLGTLMLQNESVRAVGNMGVNARGDVLDRSLSLTDVVAILASIRARALNNSS
jgi:hypothetical protein